MTGGREEGSEAKRGGENMRERAEERRGGGEDSQSDMRKAFIYVVR